MTPNDLAAQNAAIAAATSFITASGGSIVGLATRLISASSSVGLGGYIAFGRSFGEGSRTGIFVSQLTIREDHHDEMIITEHPVAVGPGPAPVSDHAYVRPADLVLDCLWSNSGNGPTFAKDIYDALLRLRNERQVFAVYTGKRVYKDMLLPGLDAYTDESTEFALRATLHLRQVIVTRVQNFSVSSDPSTQATPQQTQPPTDVGSKQTTTGSFSTVQSGWTPTQIPPGASSIAAGPSSNAQGDASYSFKDDTSGKLYANPVGVPIATQSSAPLGSLDSTDLLFSAPTQFQQP